MSVNAHHTIDAPTGMATALIRKTLPMNRAQYIEGYPARYGRCTPAVIKALLTAWPATAPINGTAIWLSEDGQLDTMLVMSSGTLYRMDLFYTSLLPSVGTYRYEEELDGQHSRIVLGSRTSVASGFGSTATIQSWVQFETETVLCINGLPYRYYRTELAGTDHFYLLGTKTPVWGTQDPVLTATTGGSLTPSQTYTYEYTFVDEMDREGSPSAPVEVTLSSSQNAVTVAGGTVSGSFQSETYANIYRLNPGAETFNFVAQVTLIAGAFTYTDTASDDTVNAGDVAPDPGENDPPTGPLEASGGFAAAATQVQVWKNRVVLNYNASSPIIQISNAGSPVQFSSISLPTNVDDGLRIAVGGGGDNEITGLANLGSLLCIFKRQATLLLYGDDITDFQIRPAHQRGCQNPNSVQRCENVVLFLSDDGVYSLGYENGYSIRKVSVDVDDLFRGFTPTRDSNPVSTGREQSVSTASAITANVSSFYFDNRYYLSFGDKTLCYDFLAPGWSNTGWGFVKTAAPYLSQNPAAISGYNGCPPAVLLTLASLSTTATSWNYFTLADTWNDPDAPQTTNLRIFTRTFDGDTPTQPMNRKKRAKRFSLYGSVDDQVPVGTVIGQITGWADGKAVESYPIYNGFWIDAPDALYQQEWTMMTGYELWVDVLLTHPSSEINTTKLEYSFLS